MKKIFLIVTGITFLAVACNNETDKTTTTETTDTTALVTESPAMDTAMMTGPMMQGMHGMMAQMKSLQMTGDFDMDYANAMIVHHQGALNMAQVQVSQGKDPQMTKMAQDILTHQKAEQDDLKNFVSTYKTHGMKHGEGELRKSMDEMSGSMMAKPMTGDVDKDFAAMMQAHHEHGVAMDKLQLEHGMSDKLKAMAKKSIASQQKEIAAFKTWLTSH